MNNKFNPINDQPIRAVSKNNFLSEKELTVIVPMFNVGTFLEDSLTSLVNSGIDENKIRIIMIDDGSTDDTFDRAEEFVNKFPKIFELYKYIHKGAEASQNRGVQMANSPFITFFDPTSSIAFFSYKKMLDKIQKSKSQLIIGGVQFTNSNHKQTQTSEIEHYNNKVELKKITLSDYPNFIWNTTVFNKIFRLDFFLNNNLFFPEVLPYTSEYSVIAALQEATSIDYFDDIAYNFQLSKTKKIDNDNAIERFRSKYWVIQNILNDSDFLENKSVLRTYFVKVLSFDIWEWIEEANWLLLAEEEKEIFYAEIKKVISKAETDFFQELAYEKQVLLRIWIFEEKETVFEAINDYVKRNISSKSTIIGNELTVYNSLQRYTPKSKFELTKTFFENNAHIEIEKVTQNQKNVQITGLLLFEYIDAPNLDDFEENEIHLVDQNGELIQRKIGNLDWQISKTATERFGVSDNQRLIDFPEHNYDYSKFVATIPIEKLESIENETPYFFQLEIKKFSYSLTKIVSNSKTESVSNLEQTGYFLNDSYFSFEMTADNTLKLQKTENFFVAENVQQIKDGIEINVSELNNKFVSLLNTDSSETIPLPVSDDVVVISKKNSELLQVVTHNQNNTWQLVVSESENSTNYSPVRMMKNNFSASIDFDEFVGNIFLSKNVLIFSLIEQVPLVEKLDVSKKRITIEYSVGGVLNQTRKHSLSINGKIFKTKKISSSNSRKYFRVIIPFDVSVFGEFDNKPVGVKIFYTFKRKTLSIPLRTYASFSLEQYKKIQLSEKTKLTIFIDRPTNYSQLFFAFSPDKGNVDVSRYDFFRKEYANYLNNPIDKNVIMYGGSWNAKNNDSSPKIIFDFIEKKFPKMKHVIVSDRFDNKYKNKKNVSYVIFDSAEFWEYVAIAKYFVTNNPFELGLRGRIKRPEQIELQTTKGLSFFKQGFQNIGEWASAEFNRLTQSVADWDYANASSDESSQIISGAFGFHKKMINIGYPKADLLLQKNTIGNVASLKKRLRIPKNKYSILFLPASDLESNASNIKHQTRESFPFDLAYLLGELGEDKQLIISQKDALNFNLPESFNNDSRIIIVDERHSAEELFLVSDLLVTDYAPGTFDYVLLDKPIIFYDYMHKRQSKNFIQEFIEGTPGPIAIDENQFYEELKKVESIPAKYGEVYANFKSKYTSKQLKNSTKETIKTFIRSK